MSRNLLKKSITVLAALCATVFFTGCSQEPIFWSIEHEVVLSKASIIGNIYAVKGVNGKIYAANGYLYVKDAGATPGTEWARVGLPTGNRCIGLAVESTNLYGLFNYIDSDQKLIYSVYSYDGSNWTQIVLPEEGYVPHAVFDDGTKAYVTLKNSSSQYTIAALSGSPVTPYVTGTSDKPFFGATSYNGNTYFGASNGIWTYTVGALHTVPDSPSSNVVGIVANSKFLYTVTENSVHYWDGSAWKTSSPSFGVPYSLSLVTSDSRLLIGTSSGYRQVGFDPVTGVPSGSLIPVPSNADAAIGSYRVHNIYVAEGGNAPGNNYVLYASVFDTTDGSRSGLWAYYSPSRPEWNRE